MKGRSVLDVVVAVLVVAIVYVLVRPQSKGADLVKALSQALQGIVGVATDTQGG